MNEMLEEYTLEESDAEIRKLVESLKQLAIGNHSTLIIAWPLGRF